jgi:hypothetical protein
MLPRIRIFEWTLSYTGCAEYNAVSVLDMMSSGAAAVPGAPAISSITSSWSMVCWVNLRPMKKEDTVSVSDSHLFL